QKTKGKIELFNTKAGVLQILCVILHLLVDSLPPYFITFQTKKE
ncbi:hypothetical protein HMPREF6485_2211, partial [Segatella buccae ATCC 33574]